METRTRVVAAALALLVVSVGAVPLSASTASTSAQDRSYTVTVTFPGNFTVGDNQTMAVEVNNSQSSEDLFNPIVEVPIPASVSVSPSATETAYVVLENRSREHRTAEVDNSTYRDGQAFFVNGEEVPAGETRTYQFNLTFENAGEHTVEAEVRPLYNDSVRVRDNATATALDFGTLNARVVKPSGSNVTNATVAIDGTARGASASARVVEGNHTVEATAPDAAAALPTMTLTIEPNDNGSVTYVARDSVATPGVLARTTSASVLNGSVGTVTTEPNAERREVGEVSYLLETAGGRAIVGLAHPLSTYQSVTTATERGTVTANETNSTLRMDVRSSDDTTVNATYTGYKLGDANADGAVNASDARSVAAAVASGESGTEYHDANGDGKVTAVDAMYVAQYDAGNRDVAYRLTEGGA
jgi:hypothetical protein